MSLGFSYTMPGMEKFSLDLPRDDKKQGMCFGSER